MRTKRKGIIDVPAAAAGDFTFGPVIRLKFNNGNPIPMTPEEIAIEDAENKNFKIKMTVVSIDAESGTITVK